MKDLFCDARFLTGISSRNISFQWTNFLLGEGEDSGNINSDTQNQNSHPKLTRDTLSIHLSSWKYSSG